MIEIIVEYWYIAIPLILSVLWAFGLIGGIRFHSQAMPSNGNKTFNSNSNGREWRYPYAHGTKKFEQ